MAAPVGVALLALRVVVVAAVGTIPVPLLEELLRAIAIFTRPPEAPIVVPTCPADPIALTPTIERTPLPTARLGAIELPLRNQLIALALPCPLEGHIGAVGPRPWHHAVVCGGRAAVTLAGAGARVRVRARTKICFHSGTATQRHTLRISWTPGLRLPFWTPAPRISRTPGLRPSGIHRLPPWTPGLTPSAAPRPPARLLDIPRI